MRYLHFRRPHRQDSSTTHHYSHPPRDSALHRGIKRYRRPARTSLSRAGSLPSPRVDDSKYGVPTIGSLGITSANQFGVLFNATETGGDSINVLDLTLKF